MKSYQNFVIVLRKKIFVGKEAKATDGAVPSTVGAQPAARPCAAVPELQHDHYEYQTHTWVLFFF
jgi:hypothetical protein